jgi:hypothetical protein
MLEIMLAVSFAAAILYLKGRNQRFFYYGRNPLKGHKSFVGFSTTGGK